MNEVLINDIPYVDGGIENPISTKEIIKRHPNKKIIYVMNQNPTSFSFLRQARGLIEALVSLKRYPKLFKAYLYREAFRQNEYKLAMTSKQVELIFPKKNESISISTSDRETLIDYFNLGKKYGNKVTELLIS